MPRLIFASTTGTLSKLAYAAGMAITVSACATSSPAAPGPAAPAPVAPAPPPSPSDVAGQAASVAYLGMWKAMADAAATSDYQSPQIPAHATGDALMTITNSLYADHANGVVTRGHPISAPQVESTTPPHDPTAVMIVDCGDSSPTYKVFANTGAPVDNERGGRQAIRAEVLRQPDGSWRVNRFAIQAVGTC